MQRWDAIRYLILYKLGGLYVDMDYECIENITPLLYGVTCGIGLEPFGHNVSHRRPFIVGNAFMASIPNHPFMQELINTIFYDNVKEKFGSSMLTTQYKNSGYQNQVTLIPAGLITPLTQNEVIKIFHKRVNKAIENKVEQAYAIRYFLDSWYR